MRVTVDTGLCCGSGQCVLAVPEVFDQRDEDGIVRLLDPNPPAAAHPDVRIAAGVCPSGAIQVHDD
jgi:ferredoxin